MLQSSMGRSLENRLDKQTESQELLKPGANFPIEKETVSLNNSHISSDTDLETKKPPVSEKAEHPKSERNGIKHKTTNSWKNNIVEEVQNGASKETNGNITQPVSSDSPDAKTMEKSDSPMSLSTPNDSSESSLSESPQDNKSKVRIVPTTSEDEVPTLVENIENNRARKKRRYDVRGENGNEENGPMPVGNNKSEEVDENEKPRTEVQNDLKEVEIDFAQLRDQFYREQIGELEKEVAMINQGTHRDLISRMEEIEQKRQRRLEIAESRKKYQVMHCQKQYEEAEYKAQCEFMSDQYETQRKKLDDMESRKWRIIREKNRLDVLGRIECTGPNHNQLTHRKNKKLSNVAELKYVQTHCGFPAASMLDSLNKSEIEDDLILLGIAREDEMQAVATLSLSSSSSPKLNTISGPILDSSNNPFLAEAENDIHAAGDKFLYFGQLINKGDQVLINDSASGRYTAKFVAATESEVVIQRPDGSRTRLQMNLLKEGKYQIRLKDS